MTDFQEQQPAPWPYQMPAARQTGTESTGSDQHTGRSERRGVKVHSPTEAINTETATGGAMRQIIGVLAELVGNGRPSSAEMRGH